MLPAMSSRYFATAVIIPRAESFTLDGAWPSAQLIVASAVALLPGVALSQRYKVKSRSPISPGIQPRLAMTMNITAAIASHNQTARSHHFMSSPPIHQ